MLAFFTTMVYNKKMNNSSHLQITTAAASKVYELQQLQTEDNLKLRISIRGGGCQGFQYDFALEPSNRDDDFSFSQPIDDNEKSSIEKSITVLVDPTSMGYLRGAEVDYRKDENGERFIIRNPNAKTTCGCDRSFAS